MALSNEDKKDVAREFGKSHADKIARATIDRKYHALRSGKTKQQQHDEAMSGVYKPTAKSKALESRIKGKKSGITKGGFNYGGMMKDLVKHGFGGVKTSSLKGKSVSDVAKEY